MLKFFRNPLLSLLGVFAIISVGCQKPTDENVGGFELIDSGVTVVSDDSLVREVTLMITRFL